MSKIKKTLSVIASAAVTTATVLGGVKVSALNIKSYSVAQLVAENKIKAFGRYSITDDKMSGFWAGNGIELNAKVKGDGILQLDFDTNDKVYFAVFIDGKEQDRLPSVTYEQNTLAFKIPEGKHTVRIIRDTQINKSGEKYLYFKSMKLGGELLKCPEDKDYYIEIIGDSIACGDGANGHYVKGESWKDPEDHSFVKGFAYKLAQMLDADYSAVARGGIGLFGDTSGSQEQTENRKITMQEIYDFTNGYYDLTNGGDTYSFERKPDLIIFELSGNDTTTMEDMWKQNVIDFLNHVHELNGKDVPIVWSGRSDIHCATIQAIIRENALESNNLYSCYYKYGGSGAAALKTQTAGHPDNFEQTQIAENLFKFLKMQENIKLPEITADNKTDENSDSESTELTLSDNKHSSAKKAGMIGGAALGAAALGTAAYFITKKLRKK